MTTTSRVRTPLPNSKDIREILEGLLGRDVTVSPGEPVIPRQKTPGTVAVYTDRFMSMRATVVFDIALSAGVGAALGLLPVDQMTEAVDKGELSEGILENLQEVLNVVTGSFNVGEAPHVSLYQVVKPGDVAPVDVSVMLRTFGRRLDLDVEIQGYGKGSLSVVCV